MEPHHLQPVDTDTSGFIVMQQSVPTLLDYSEVVIKIVRKPTRLGIEQKKRQLFNQIGISTNQKHMRKYHVGANLLGLSADFSGIYAIKLGRAKLRGLEFSDHDLLERIKDSISNGHMASFKFD